MKGTPSLWRRSIARVLVLAVVAALAPLPLAAADQNTPPPGLKTSAAKIGAAERLVGPKAPAVQAQKEPASGVGAQSGSFFRTPAGIALVAVLAAGTGYALYSTSHDRIKSQAR